MDTKQALCACDVQHRAVYSRVDPGGQPGFVAGMAFKFIGSRVV